MKNGVRYWELDVFRFFAAFAVMAMHYLIRGFDPDEQWSPFHFQAVGPGTRYFYLAVNFSS